MMCSSGSKGVQHPAGWLWSPILLALTLACKVLGPQMTERMPVSPLSISAGSAYGIRSVAIVGAWFQDCGGWIQNGFTLQVS